MSEEIIKVLDDLASRLGVAIDWSSKNVLPYLTELAARYIKYEMVIYYLWLAFHVITIILIIMSIRALVKSAKYACEHKKDTLMWEVYSDGKLYEPETLGWILLIFIAFGTVLTFIALPGTISNILELSIIPEVYIYENLFKGVV